MIQQSILTPNTQQVHRLSMNRLIPLSEMNASVARRWAHGISSRRNLAPDLVTGAVGKKKFLEDLIRIRNRDPALLRELVEERSLEVHRARRFRPTVHVRGVYNGQFIRLRWVALFYDAFPAFVTVLTHLTLFFASGSPGMRSHRSHG
jgi:hypothetical protein